MRIMSFDLEEKRLKELAETLHLDKVEFTGYVADEALVSYYSLAQAVVFPSSERSEAFGVTIIEALMMGKPVISTELGTGTSFVNKDGETGIVVPPKDPEALNQALRLFLEDDEQQLLFAGNAKKRYLSLFTPEVNAEEYIKLYRKLASDNLKVAEGALVG